MKRAAVLASLSLGLACIVPDRGIQFEGGPGNPGAVRILEHPPVPAQWTQWCLDRDADVAAAEADVEGGTAAFCASIDVSQTRPGGLVRDEDGSFCVCPDGESDLRAPMLWTVYAEDPDLDDLDAPDDTLYGVLLLDPNPLSDEPTTAVAYENYLEPCASGRLLDDARRVAEPVRTDEGLIYPERIEPPIVRDEAPQWAFDIDDASSERLDLCNDDNGSPIEPGLHNLQFMVTDRPFFRAVRDDIERLQCGVPDVAAGATYAVVNYVFECVDGTLEENADLCDCGDPQ